MSKGLEMSIEKVILSKTPQAYIAFSNDLQLLGKKVKAGTASIASGGTISTGLSSIDTFIAIPQESTSGVAYMVKITAISGGDVTLEIDSFDGTTFTAGVTTAITIHWIAVGE